MQLDEIVSATLEGEGFEAGRVIRSKMARLTIEYEFINRHSFYCRVLDGETVLENRLFTIAWCDLPLDTTPPADR